MPFRFNTLLDELGVNPADVRLLRHQPVVGGRQLADVWRGDRATFEAYQSLQTVTKRVQFARRYWASFVGTWDGRTMFSGLYAVGQPTPVLDHFVSPLSGNAHTPGEYDKYQTDHVDALREYEGRLYIEWGGGSSGRRAWVQRADAQNKLVSELHQTVAGEPFPGLMEIARPLSALADVPPTWVEQLSAAKGVYLLSCPRDGSLYVGSATAAGGFWDRWVEYRENGHGGNVALRGRTPSDFVVSILQVAGSTDTNEDILTAEGRWKRKLLSRELGLNRN